MFEPLIGRFLLALALCQTCQAALIKHKKPSFEIQVPCGNLFGAGSDAPVRQLDRALKRHPNARLFRVSWDSSGTLGQDEAIALFDRKKCTLKLVYRDWWYVDRETYAQRSTGQDVWLYTRVTDISISKLRNAVVGKNIASQGNDASLGYFPKLTKFGCKVRQVKHYAKSWNERL